MSRPPARMFAHWRTGLSGPVIVLQAGTAVNYFGTGLILPFEIIYLHELRGFPTTTAGLVLAAVIGTAAVVTHLPRGATALEDDRGFYEYDDSVPNSSTGSGAGAAPRRARKALALIAAEA